jgi:hypothetical protein
MDRLNEDSVADYFSVDHDQRYLRHIHLHDLSSPL